MPVNTVPCTGVPSCPICASGLLPNVAVPVYDHSARAVKLWSMPQKVWNKIKQCFPKDEEPAQPQTPPPTPKPFDGTLDEFVVKMGFDDTEEFFRLLSSVDIFAAWQQNLLRLWQLHDGTKAGLLKVIEQTGTRSVR